MSVSDTRRLSLLLIKDDGCACNRERMQTLLNDDSCICELMHSVTGNENKLCGANSGVVQQSMGTKPLNRWHSCAAIGQIEKRKKKEQVVVQLFAGF
ncbi:hypothetical protein OUZ56_013715 [Daphnia magna]|uniref:Uncharacterized protein n=1 Tax=Daphnia magna TaxID=35525 RepID=A0ABQ9Z6R4_9CRUS|nr:hypothetical protein OUZ56_013715 [Daphnia magna]